MPLKHFYSNKKEDDDTPAVLQQKRPSNEPDSNDGKRIKLEFKDEGIPIL